MLSCTREDSLYEIAPAISLHVAFATIAYSAESKLKAKERAESISEPGSESKAGPASDLRTRLVLASIDTKENDFAKETIVIKVAVSEKDSSKLKCINVRSTTLALSSTMRAPIPVHPSSEGCTRRIILAFTTGDYNQQFPATIGVDYKCKVMEVSGMKVKLGIWDTAGQERYRTLTSSFYRDAHGAILVYDVSDPKTLVKLKEWVEELQVYSTKKNIVCLVVGNKIDKPRVVPREDGQAFAQRHRMLFIESSAKTQEGINLAFEELVQKIIETPGLWESGSNSNIRVSSEKTQPKQSSCYEYTCNI
ncbi:Ras-related protein Rab-18 [Eumeta japonica]|uniref:Ras-related protein Rab-18 n=1 Tax=Eumeta variegata TaxID=151549 RepID=A0A4C1Z8C1_EUMVA|nr:Ras-related protein Rab-18 [Eumeta japonica]